MTDYVLRWYNQPVWIHRLPRRKPPQIHRYGFEWTRQVENATGFPTTDDAREFAMAITLDGGLEVEERTR